MQSYSYLILIKREDLKDHEEEIERTLAAFGKLSKVRDMYLLKAIGTDAKKVQQALLSLEIFKDERDIILVIQYISMAWLITSEEESQLLRESFEYNKKEEQYTIPGSQDFSFG